MQPSVAVLVAGVPPLFLRYSTDSQFYLAVFVNAAKVLSTL